MSDGAESNVQSETEGPPQRDPVRKWTIVVAVLLLFLLVLQIASDRTAPVTSIGTVEGLVLPISSRVSGELLKVFVSDDEIVEAGTLLFEIDPTPFRLAVESAEADLVQVGQSIGASTADVAAAQARVAEAEAELINSRAQADRTLDLVARGVTSEAQGDEATAQVSTDEATLVAAEADLRSAEEALGPAGADNPQLRAAQAALETAQFNLGQTRVFSTSRGRVTNFSLGIGETVNAGQPVLTMIDLRGAWMIAYFRENQLSNLQVDDSAEVVLDVLPGQVWPARVVSFAGGKMTVNQSSPPGGLVDTPPQQQWMAEPQRFGVRLLFDPPDEWPPNVRLGSQATVMVYTQ
jgi:multidrug resistance efflux pump